MSYNASSVCEGAFNNLPDEAAQLTAMKILKMVSGAGEEDIVLVLVSGGGSALLPCPVEGVTLAEKRQVTQQTHTNFSAVGTKHII